MATNVQKLEEIAGSVPVCLQKAAKRVLQVAQKQPINSVFLTRALNALVGLTQSEDLVGVTSASNDYELLLSILQTPEAIAMLSSSDPLAKAKLKGLEVKQQLVLAEGGCISSEQAGNHLGISRQAVDKRRRNGKLIGLSRGKGSYLYPVWQFASSGTTIPGLEAVLEQLSTFNPWMQVAFFLNPNLRLNNLTPLKMLKRGEIEVVVESAVALANDEPD